MTAQKLRDAAARIRDTAQLANEGPWRQAPLTHIDQSIATLWRVEGPRTDLGGRDHEFAYTDRRDDARHIALWPPPVALAVADWLTAEADFIEAGEPTTGHPQAVADLILGRAR